MWRPIQRGSMRNADGDAESRTSHAPNINNGFSCYKMTNPSDLEGSAIPPHEDHNEMALPTLLSPSPLSPSPNFSCNGNSKLQPGGQCGYLYMDIFYAKLINIHTAQPLNAIFPGTSIMQRIATAIPNRTAIVVQMPITDVGEEIIDLLFIAIRKLDECRAF